MKTIRRFTAWILIAAVIGHSVLPVEAAGQTAFAGAYKENGAAVQRLAEECGTEEYPAVSEEVTEGKPVVSENAEGTTEQPTTETTEQPSTEAVTTEQPSTETVTTEQSSTEAATTEQSTTEIPVDPNLKPSGLSPATARVIVIDPGHCNTHPGAAGNGLREEQVVLDIALECQRILDTYADVSVYMTREDGSCPSVNGLGDDLISRNNYAKQLDADFLVSMHINAGRTNGANVLSAYKSGYHDNIRKETQKFGKLALKKLKALGIANRGLLLRKSGTGNRYSNGKLTDYYSIVRNGVIQNIPSVIIEHGYISSASDCTKFFKTKAKRQKVGKADADAIISYYGLKQKVISGTLKTEGEHIYYMTKDGKKAGGWVKNDGKWYYFDERNGAMRTGFVTVGEDTFYLSPSTGEMLTGWFTVDGKRYLARGNGTLVRNQTYSDGRYVYLFDGTGIQLKKGFRTVDGQRYYVNNKNVTVAGKQKIKGAYYYFDSETRQMLTGWQKISGKYYYFDKTSGKMQKSKWIGKYYVNAKGIRTKKK